MYVTPADVTVSCDWQCHKNRNPPSLEPGTDYNTPYGTDIRMAGDGVIVITDGDPSGAEGRRLELVMDTGEVIDYLHLSKIMGQWNQRVKKGQTGIALSGASGHGVDWYYGPHVHVTRRAKPGLPYADSLDFELAIDVTPSGGGGQPFPLAEMDEMSTILFRRTDKQNAIMLHNEHGVRHIPDNQTYEVELWAINVSTGQPFNPESVKADPKNVKPNGDPININEQDYRRFVENRGFDYNKVAALAPGDFLNNNGNVVVKPVW